MATSENPINLVQSLHELRQTKEDCPDEPVAIVGISNGANMAMMMSFSAAALNMEIDLLVTLDVMYPIRGSAPPISTLPQAIKPPNVKIHLNITSDPDGYSKQEYPWLVEANAMATQIFIVRDIPGAINVMAPYTIHGTLDDKFISKPDDPKGFITNPAWELTRDMMTIIMHS
ncbi:hypothetical protein HC891_23915 [Candidatus Gracilibacteria bacterium]|nr:hypothetical protein [Candidatus Gracilibacteria bacterium]